MECRVAEKDIHPKVKREEQSNMAYLDSSGPHKYLLCFMLYVIVLKTDFEGVSFFPFIPLVKE